MTLWRETLLANWPLVLAANELLGLQRAYLLLRALWPTLTHAFGFQ